MKKGILFLAISLMISQVFAQECGNRGKSFLYRSSQENLRSDTIDVLNYTINLDIKDFTNKVIDGNCLVTFRTLMPSISTLSLDLLAMTIDSVEDGTGNNLTYNYNDTLLLINLPATLNLNDTSSVNVYYHGAPVMDPSGWGGFYWNGNYAFNLGVGFASLPHNYGRVWHPCFDNFKERATYDLYIATDNGKVAYANGELMSTTINGTETINHWQMRDPICSYLAGVNVAPYTHVEQNYLSPLTSNNTPIWLTCLASDSTNLKNSFINLPLALEAFEYEYGAYVWNKVGYSLVPFSSGAMEHATNISYPLATVNGNTTYETLMAHELSHHWWGDLVTCETAEEMWINEGMAAYSEKLFLEYVYGATAYFNEVRNNHKNVLWKAHVDDGGYWALANVPQVVTYGTTTYDKGADVVHTLRSYMGDALFAQGLQTIITNYAFKNISSTQFRDELNSIPGVNVTDFFNDWIFNEGFPEFSVDSFSVTPNGPNFDVRVYVQQKLRGAPNYFTSVPINVFFRDANWNLNTQQLVASGQYSNFLFTVPFNPVFVTLNEDEKISDAVTGETYVIKSTGLKNFNHPGISITTNSIVDSALIRIENHWVAADDFQNANFLITLSPDRYYRVNGIDLNKTYTTARYIFNGTTSGAGYLDNGLMVDHGSVLFHEDSLVLLYRSSPREDWSIYPYFQIQTQASKLDKIGAVFIDSLKAGDYALGIKTSALAVETNQAEQLDFKLFPNPAKDNVILEMKNPNNEKRWADCYDINGKLVMSQLFIGEKLTLQLEGISKGTYLMQVRNQKKVLATQKFLIN